MSKKTKGTKKSAYYRDIPFLSDTRQKLLLKEIHATSDSKATIRILEKHLKTSLDELLGSESNSKKALKITEPVRESNFIGYRPKNSEALTDFLNSIRSHFPKYEPEELLPALYDYCLAVKLTEIASSEKSPHQSFFLGFTVASILSSSVSEQKRSEHRSLTSSAAGSRKLGSKGPTFLLIDTICTYILKSTGKFPNSKEFLRAFKKAEDIRAIAQALNDLKISAPEYKNGRCMYSYGGEFREFKMKTLLNTLNEIKN